MSLSIIEYNNMKCTLEDIFDELKKYPSSEEIEYYAIMNKFLHGHSDNVGYAKIQIHAKGKREAVILMHKAEDEILDSDTISNIIDEIIEMYDCDNIKFNDQQEFISELSEDIVEKCFTKDEIRNYLEKVKPFSF